MAQGEGITIAEALGEIRDGRALIAEGQQRVEEAYRALEAALARAALAAATPRGSNAYADLADATDRVLLGALASGMLRKSLPRHTGLPRRAVDARLKRLQELSGSTTLYMLGARAQAFGWHDVLGRSEAP